MTDGRWGADQWGSAEWGSGDAVAHSLSARAGVVANAYADRLGPRHALQAMATVRTVTYGIGAGPGAIHPLGAVSTVGSGATGGALRSRHLLEATATVRSATGAARLRKQHPLRADAAITVTASGWLSILHHLEAWAQIRSAAAAAGLTAGHPLRAIATIRTDAGAVYTIAIPEILEPSMVGRGDPTVVIPGALNLIGNPIAAQGLMGWEPVGDAELTIDLTFAWDGRQSVRVAPGSDGSGVQISTPRPLGLATLEGAVVWGQAMLALNVPGVPVLAPEDPPIPMGPPDDTPAPLPRDPFWVTGWVEVTYSDGSIDAGDPPEPFPVVATGYQADWDIFLASFTPAASKVVVAARLIIVSTPEPSMPAAFWVGGAQLEYDRWMVGPQPVRSTSALAQTQLQPQEAI